MVQGQNPLKSEKVAETNKEMPLNRDKWDENCDFPAENQQIFDCVGK